MKKPHLALFLLLLIVPILPRFAAAELRYELGRSEAFRSDQLDWNIAGNNINILSELTWEDVAVWQLGLHGEVAAREADWPFLTSVLRGEIAAGFIYEGENRDSDYAADNRTLEFSRSNNNADEGHTYDASLAAGLLFDLGQSNFSLGPFLGYAWHEQQLRMTDGWQTVSNQSYADFAFGPGVVQVQPLGPFAGLDSSYNAEWRGPWAGIEGVWKPSPRWQLRVASELHSVDYEGVADWNLRADLAHPKSFQHTGSGHGVVFNLDGSWLLWRHLALGAGFRYGEWQIKDGRHRMFFADDSFSDTDLNEVNWESAVFSLRLSGRF